MARKIGFLMQHSYDSMQHSYGYLHLCSTEIFKSCPSDDNFNL